MHHNVAPSNQPQLRIALNTSPSSSPLQPPTSCSVGPGSSTHTSSKDFSRTPAIMSGEVLKAEKDFTKEVDKAIPEAESLAKVRFLC